MSNDRGCWKCWREQWEYKNCPYKNCVKIKNESSNRALLSTQVEVVKAPEVNKAMIEAGIEEFYYTDYCETDEDKVERIYLAMKKAKEQK
jgi:hypothetical protein